MAAGEMPWSFVPLSGIIEPSHGHIPLKQWIDVEDQAIGFLDILGPRVPAAIFERAVASWTGRNGAARASVLACWSNPLDGLSMVTRATRGQCPPAMNERLPLVGRATR